MIAALSSGWENYRHQADALRQYQLLRAGGVPADHIILMMANDVASAAQNPLPGTVRNQVGHIWLVERDAQVYTAAPDLRQVSTTDARAVWLNRSLVKWPRLAASGSVRLYHSATGQIRLGLDQPVQGAERRGPHRWIGVIDELAGRGLIALVAGDRGPQLGGVAGKGGGLAFAEVEALTLERGAGGPVFVG